MPPSSEQNFRTNLSQFRWARGVTDDSQQTQQPLQSSNPFSRFYNAVAGDYIPLRSSERSNEEEAWFALSRWERYAFNNPILPFSITHTHRLLGFGACLLGAAACFFVAFLSLPFLALNPAKFALAFRYAQILVHSSSALMTLFAAWGACS